MLSVFRHLEDTVVISGQLVIEIANVNDLLVLVSVRHVECNAA
jgi:hypothetical protein